MARFVAAYADATYEDTNRSYEDSIARAIRLARGDDVLTDEQRAQIFFNRLPHEVRSRFFENNLPPVLAPNNPPPPGPGMGGGRRGIVRPRSPSPSPSPSFSPRSPSTSPPPLPSPLPPQLLPPLPRPPPRPEARTVRINPLPEVAPPNHPLDPPPRRDLHQRWNDVAGLYTPDGEAPHYYGGAAFTVEARRTLMYRAMDIVETSIPGSHMHRVRISWSPSADWLGLHEIDGTIYMNLALLDPALEAYIGTLIHELAHDATHAHDRTWGMNMQRLFERLLSRVAMRTIF